MAEAPRKYAEQMVDWLTELGYTHCFFVAGGNIMHLLDAVRTRLTCIPVVHEVAAGMAVEYFNETADEGRKALALVTAGPGLTNIVTAVAAAWLESRELLVIGGQVKSTDLATDGVRQRGIQEVDGVSVVAPLTVTSMRIERPVPYDVFAEAVIAGRRPRQGPVFIEVCLDAQAAPVVPDAAHDPPTVGSPPAPTADELAALLGELRRAQRPVLLLGGGVSRAAAASLQSAIGEAGIPVMTTWNGTDRIPADHPLAWGRPNTWGQRGANLLLQQADLAVALGSRLGLQQTGFAWEHFVPNGRVVQVDIDPAELHKGHPAVDLRIAADADSCLRAILETAIEEGWRDRWADWRAFGRSTLDLLPLAEEVNTPSTGPGYLDPYRFVGELSDTLESNDLIVPASSGGAFTVMMQAFRQKRGQLVVSDKGLASMGHGLSGAIGVAIANPSRRVIHVEGDGGFAQNVQELGTVAAQRLNIKTFLLHNEGYASIRMTQRSYFGGAYVGCDTATGLGLPDWATLFRAYGIPCSAIDPENAFGPATLDALGSDGPHAFLVPIDPEQTYFPKITSRVRADGGMESNPLHLMSPDVTDDVASQDFRFVDRVAEEQ
jgi:acetolactate synthase-1/2/3 large subunit